MSRRCWSGSLIFGALLLVPAGTALAQLPPQSMTADPEGLAREAVDRAAAMKTCWERGDAVGADWLAERDPAYRNGPYAQHLLEVEDHGWQWLSAELRAGTDVHSVAKGTTDRVLRIGGRDAAEGWATLRVDGPLRSGEVRLEWTAPPKRICMADTLALEARAAVSEGSPGSASVLFVVPLTKDLLAAAGPEVRACSPGNDVAVDSELGVSEDRGRCERSLYHLRPDAAWAVWVSLPESFYVVYPYEPARSRR